MDARRLPLWTKITLGLLIAAAFGWAAASKVSRISGQLDLAAWAVGVIAIGAAVVVVLARRR